MKIIEKILVIVLLVSCSNGQLTLEQYANQPVKVAMQRINYPGKEFTIFIPQNWNWKIEEYVNDNILLGIDAVSPPDGDGFIDMISIQKLKSFSGKRDLDSEFKYWLDLLEKKSQSEKIVEVGGTRIFKRKAYFFHTKSDTGTYGETEIISFILDSGAEGVFYNLVASASQTKDLEMNMAILIQSLKTFETDPAE